MNNLVGITIGGRYHIIEPLGQGGMATVYKAYDTRLERTVAIKVIRTGAIPPEQLAQMLRRFEREAKAVALLDHLHVVKVYDYGEHESAPYLVTQYPPGGSLKDRTGKPMPYAEAARLLLPVAQALAYAHRHGVIHRDVKPANILISQEGEVMLSDFGIAKVLSGEIETTALTGTGVGIGTPEYMAPEQWRGEAIPATDIYALGVVLYELITGRKPYSADTPAAVAIKQATEPLPRPADFVPHLPEEVEHVLFKALAKQPEGRYTIMGDMAKALEALISLKITDTPAIQRDTANRSRQDSSNPSYRWSSIFEHAKGSAVDQLTLNRTSAGDQAGLRGRVRERKAVKPWLWMLGVLLVVATGSFLLTNSLRKTNALHTQTAVALRTQEPSPELVEGTISESDAGVIETPTHTSTHLESSPQPTDAVTTTSASTPTQTQTQTQTKEPSPSPVVVTKIAEIDGMVMVYVPAGEFNMGQKGVMEPVHTVYLDAFWIDRTEVTNAMFADFLNQQGNQMEGGTTWLNAEDGDVKIHLSSDGIWWADVSYLDHPVIEVTWYGAQAYCSWAGRRLPTEAEWEKAARGLDGRTYPWGEGIDCKKAQYNVCYKDSAPADSLPAGASPYGAVHMAGNVWEWTADWLDEDYYKISPLNNPQGPSTGIQRVMRGGSRFESGKGVLSAQRNAYPPSETSLNVGFRCVLSP